MSSFTLWAPYVINRGGGDEGWSPSVRIREGSRVAGSIFCSEHIERVHSHPQQPIWSAFVRIMCRIVRRMQARHEELINERKDAFPPTIGVGADTSATRPPAEVDLGASTSASTDARALHTIEDGGI